MSALLPAVSILLLLSGFLVFARGGETRLGRALLLSGLAIAVIAVFMAMRPDFGAVALIVLGGSFGYGVAALAVTAAGGADRARLLAGSNACAAFAALLMASAFLLGDGGTAAEGGLHGWAGRLAATVSVAGGAMVLPGGLFMSLRDRPAFVARLVPLARGAMPVLAVVLLACAVWLAVTPGRPALVCLGTVAGLLGLAVYVMRAERERTETLALFYAICGVAVAGCGMVQGLAVMTFSGGLVAAAAFGLHRGRLG